MHVPTDLGPAGAHGGRNHRPHHMAIAGHECVNQRRVDEAATLPRNWTPSRPGQIGKPRWYGVDGHMSQVFAFMMQRTPPPEAHVAQLAFGLP